LFTIQCSSLLEDFEKHHALKINKGVVGITGKTVPNTPKLTDKKPKIK
tara:strand:+ start:20823 stop:20966 length:144 start_codon:yes stop_codon:yes gene_type:complete